MSINVVIVKAETKQCHPNIDNLRKAFSDQIFDITIFDTEGRRSREYLKKIFDRFSTPLIIVKDDSVCQLSSRNLAKLINQGLEFSNRNDIDILYLSSWGEKCDRQRELLNTEDGTVIKSSTGNRSSQAILFNDKASKEIRSELSSSETLSEAISKLTSQGTLKAASYSPNLVHFDNVLAKTKRDYIKSNYCDIKPAEKNNTYIYIWLIILILLIVLIVWLLI